MQIKNDNGDQQNFQVLIGIQLEELLAEKNLKVVLKGIKNWIQILKISDALLDEKERRVNVVVSGTCRDSAKELANLLKTIYFQRQAVMMQLLIFGDEILSDQESTLPHPDLIQNPLMTVAAASVLPEWQHPVVENKPLSELARPFLFSGYFSLQIQGDSLLAFLNSDQ